MFLSPSSEDVRQALNKRSAPVPRPDSLSRRQLNFTVPRRETATEAKLAPEEKAGNMGVHTIEELLSFQDIPDRAPQQRQQQPQFPPSDKPSLLKYLHAEMSNPFVEPSFVPAYVPSQVQNMQEPVAGAGLFGRPAPPEETKEELPQAKQSFGEPMPLAEERPAEQQSQEAAMQDVNPLPQAPVQLPAFADERRKWKSLNIAPVAQRSAASANIVAGKQAEIRVLFDDRVRLTKLIDPVQSIKDVIAGFRATLEAKGYLFKNVKNPLVLKDENDYELDEGEPIGYYLQTRAYFKLGFRKYGPEYALAAEGAFELLDTPEKIIDMKHEGGEYRFRIAWKKRKNGMQPLPSYASEKALLCYNPAFLFDFYSQFAKKIVK